MQVDMVGRQAHINLNVIFQLYSLPDDAGMVWQPANQVGQRHV